MCFTGRLHRNLLLLRPATTAQCHAALFEQAADPLDRVARFLCELVDRSPVGVLLDEDAGQAISEPRAQALVGLQ